MATVVLQLMVATMTQEMVVVVVLVLLLLRISLRAVIVSDVTAVSQRRDNAFAVPVAITVVTDALVVIVAACAGTAAITVAV